MKVEIEFDVDVKEVEGKTYICHIPAIDTYFGAKNKQMIKDKTKAFVSSFIKEYK